MKARALLWALCLAMVPAHLPMAMAEVAEPPDFRGEPYRDPVPATLQGARVIDGPQAVRLHDQGVAFVDVYPRQQKPAGLPPGTLWHAAPHQTIPGAVWLYDTGYQRISPAEAQRLQDGLARVTQGDPARPVVIFCLSDCWMSWNAAKRAVELGYRNVIWFPEGTDGWELAGRDLVTARADDP